MITFNNLYKEWIDQIKNAMSKEDLLIDSPSMRAAAENKAISLLKLEDKYKEAWFKYYAKQKRKRSRGLTTKFGTQALSRNTQAVLGKEPLTIKQIRALKLELLKDMRRDPKNVQIGHMDHGIAMDKAKIVYDNAKVVDSIEEVGITKEQKFYLGKAILAQQAIERVRHKDITRIKKKLGLKTVSDAVLLKFLSEIDEEVKLNANFLMQSTVKGPKLSYEVEFEAKHSNSDSGDLTARLGTKMQKMLLIANKETMKEFNSSAFAKTLMNMPGSLTYLNRLKSYITNIILGVKNRIKPTRKHKEYKIESKKSKILKTAIIAEERNRKQLEAVIRRSKTEEPRVELLGAFNIMGLINAILPSHIEAQMGKSSDPPTRLRYQTGRFARSAKLEALVGSTGNPIVSTAKGPPLLGVYTYMHYPYDVFLPGHRLGSAQRDPTQFIERGIRAAARTILQDRYPGMVLEAE